MGRAISFKRPDFHFSKPLAAKLSFAAERLLGDKRVRPCGSRMHLVVHKVMQFHDINVADRDFIIEGSASAAVIKADLSVLREPSLGKLLFYNFFRHAVQNRASGFVAKLACCQSQMSFQNLTE